MQCKLFMWHIRMYINVINVLLYMHSTYNSICTHFQLINVVLHCNDNGKALSTVYSKNR